jgi:hypothetical protein
MDWEQQLTPWCKRQVEVWIEDTLGKDPVAPLKVFTLEKVKYTEERTHIQFYLNTTQFLSVPIFEEPITRWEEHGLDGCPSFISTDREAHLKYQLRWLTDHPL